MKVVAYWQELNSTPRRKVRSINITWPILVDTRHLFVWRVRSFLTIHTCLNLYSVGMHKPDRTCTDLIEATANALSGGIVALMLLAVQHDNLELSVKQAIEW